MAYTLVFEWIDEYESLIESEIHTYATEQEHNHEVMIALYNILAEPQKYKTDNLIDSICQQLLNFYRSGEPQLRKFAIQYIPALIFLHLSDKSFTAVQALLVSLYNLEVVDNKGQPKTLSFRIPSIAQSSIYHDSNTLEPAFIAESSLRRWEECNTKLVSWGPLPQVETLNAQNRQRVVTALLFLYNQQLANVLIQGIEFTSRGISRLVNQGFSSIPTSNRSSIASESSLQSMTVLPRIQISGPLLIELLHIVYHGAVRCANGAVQALHDIIQRATYESLSEVLLAASAFKNLLQHSPSISVSSRPSNTHSVSKSMITNASFRTKKLPDDIPIQDDQQNPPEAPLDSITEEQEENEKIKNKTVSALKHLPKLPGLTKKHKEKNKNCVQQGDQQNIELNNSQIDGAMDLNSDSNYNSAVHVSAV
ncbi:hyccin [Anthonomus grandis grandis]|uniref:hyccin n=1 Tax=Anthonomus grandis grandis TaxID=2921223 RepID=UPI0021662C31|nr:hyccin [Anthonomus grandis grandis]